jgi:DNA-binding protein HU-alpha
MNKTDLIDEMSVAADISKNVAGKALNALLEMIGASLKKGEPVEIVGFGKFYIRERAARKGRNPMTGLSLPSKRLVYRYSKLARH